MQSQGSSDLYFEFTSALSDSYTFSDVFYFNSYQANLKNILKISQPLSESFATWPLTVTLTTSFLLRDSSYFPILDINNNEIGFPTRDQQVQIEIINCNDQLTVPSGSDLLQPVTDSQFWIEESED